MNETLASIINAGLNTPECAYFVGQWVGSFTVVKYLIALALIGFLYTAAQKLAFEPFVQWIKKKIYGRNRK